MKRNFAKEDKWMAISTRKGGQNSWHKGNANLNHTVRAFNTRKMPEMLPPPKKTLTLNGDGIEQLELSYTVSGSIKWYNILNTWNGNFLSTLWAISLLGINLREMKTYVYNNDLYKNAPRRFSHNSKKLQNSTCPSRGRRMNKL